MQPLAQLQRKPNLSGTANLGLSPVNGGAKSSHGAEQKSASLGVTGALANALPT